MYIPLTSSPSSSSVFSLPLVYYMVADPGYDSKKLCPYSKILRIDLVFPVKRYEITSKERLEFVCFYQSVLRQTIYSKSRTSIEPLMEHIKSVFRIDQLSVLWFQTVSATVFLMGIILSDMMIYYNCMKDKSNQVNKVHTWNLVTW